MPRMELEGYHIPVRPPQLFMGSFVAAIGWHERRGGVHVGLVYASSNSGNGVGFTLRQWSVAISQSFHQFRPRRRGKYYYYRSIFWCQTNPIHKRRGYFNVRLFNLCVWHYRRKRRRHGFLLNRPALLQRSHHLNDLYRCRQWLVETVRDFNWW
jgi:hypothetical protein